MRKIGFVTNRRNLWPVVALAALVFVAGCEAGKSANPLSPAIAGPIQGVDITSPKVLEPGTGWKIHDKDQPVTFLLENATSTSPRPFTMHLEVATDNAFAAILLSRTGLTPGPNGRTSLRLEDKLQHSRSYFWRARAEDGANTSAWSAPAQFEILPPIIIGTPTPKSPVANVTTADPKPALVVTNGASSGPHGTLMYNFQLSQTHEFTGLVVNIEIPQGLLGETTFSMPSALPYNILFYWRVRTSDGLNTSAWSATQTFRTPVAPPPPPPPPPPAPSPAPSPSPGPAGSCAFNNGKQVIECISSKYADRRAPTSTFDQRHENMIFLRDRIIEAGSCGGMSLGWNLKRGGPELSVDFIAWRQSGGDMGVDIGYDYDNNSKTLELQWAEWGSFGASYAKYTNSFSCSVPEPDAEAAQPAWSFLPAFTNTLLKYFTR